MSKRSLQQTIPVALADPVLQRNLGHTLPQVVHSNRQAVEAVSNWEELRSHAHRVKSHTLARLDHYLGELEEAIVRQGGKVIWAETGRAAAEFVIDLARRHGIDRVVKSKTMVGEEIHLNEALERARITPVETDLGEYIVQLAGQTPSHIIAPALHLSKEQISQLFTEKLQMESTDDVEKITATARQKLRADFLAAGMGITGVNFGVAETGTLVIVENEGNIRLTTAAPKIHVALMGIEKVIPRIGDLAVFLKLLVRSATGQEISSYINFINGPRRPRESDGPAEFYLVLIDNGRSRVVGDDLLRQTLHCIRCGACLNVCPVYQHIGGHAYASTYSGPIGAILTPQLEGLEEAPEHPFVSSLCGACHQVCPVKIEIPRILVSLRHKVQQQRDASPSRLSLEKGTMQLWARAMRSPKLFRRASDWARRLQWLLPLMHRLPPLRRWGKQRETPALAPRSFREIYVEKEK